MIKFDNLGPVLLARFPEAAPFAEANFVELYGPNRDGAYTIFSTVLRPLLEQLVALGDFERAAEVMDFIEELANHEDSRLGELVWLELGEWLFGYGLLRKEDVERLAGPTTRMAIWNAERYLVQAERNANSSPLLTLVRRLLLPRRKR